MNKMMMSTINTIFVLGGGHSPEWEVSLGSAQFVYGELKDSYNTFLATINREEWFITDNDGLKHLINKGDFSVTINNTKIVPDIVVNLIHGSPGEDGLLQGYFDTLGIRHTSCSALSSSVTFEKVWCKRLLSELNIPMAQDIILSCNEEYNTNEIVSKLALPLFIKPSNSGSSFGVTMVKSADDIPQAIKDAHTKDGVIIIEEAIIGREVACGVFDTEEGLTLLPVTEIVSDNDFFDYKAKYGGESNEITPANITAEVVAQLNSYTTKIYRAMRCRGFVRIDFIIRDNTPYLIEVNSIPGMSKESIIPQQLAAADITVKEMFTEIFKTI